MHSGSVDFEELVYSRRYVSADLGSDVGERQRAAVSGPFRPLISEARKFRQM